MPSYLTTIAITHLYEVEVDAPNKIHLFNYEEPDYGKSLGAYEKDKLENPDKFGSPVSITKEIIDAQEAIDFTEFDN